MNDPAVPQDAKNYAVMVSMIDRQLGQVLALLKNSSSRKTPFSFLPGTMAVGPLPFSKTPARFSDPTSTDRSSFAGEGGLYEELIPFLVRPGQIKAGQTSDHVFTSPASSHPDRALRSPNSDVDGFPSSPLCSEKSHRPKTGSHEMLYWEYGNQVAMGMAHGKPSRRQKSSVGAL